MLAKAMREIVIDLGQTEECKRRADSMSSLSAHPKVDKRLMKPCTSYVNNDKRLLSMNGYAPEFTLMDLGVVPVIVSGRIAKAMHLTIVPTRVIIQTAADTYKKVQGWSQVPVVFVFR